jgi:hypothetical protein
MSDIGRPVVAASREKCKIPTLENPSGNEFDHMVDPATMVHPYAASSN